MKLLLTAILAIGLFGVAGLPQTGGAPETAKGKNPKAKSGKEKTKTAPADNKEGKMKPKAQTGTAK